MSVASRLATIGKTQARIRCEAEQAAARYHGGGVKSFFTLRANRVFLVEHNLQRPCLPVRLDGIVGDVRHRMVALVPQHPRIVISAFQTTPQSAF